MDLEPTIAYYPFPTEVQSLLPKLQVIEFEGKKARTFQDSLYHKAESEFLPKGFSPDHWISLGTSWLKSYHSGRWCKVLGLKGSCQPEEFCALLAECHEKSKTYASKEHWDRHLFALYTLGLPNLPTASMQQGNLIIRINRQEFQWAWKRVRYNVEAFLSTSVQYELFG